MEPQVFHFRRGGSETRARLRSLVASPQAKQHRDCMILKRKSLCRNMEILLDDHQRMVILQQRVASRADAGDGTVGVEVSALAMLIRTTIHSGLYFGHAFVIAQRY